MMKIRFRNEPKITSNQNTKELRGKLMYKVFGHYIPKTLLLLVIVESLILLTSIYAVSILAIGTSSPSTDHLFFPDAAMFCGVMLAVMATMGLYRRDLREQLQSILLRVSLSFIISLTIFYVFYIFYPETFFHRNVLLIGALCAFLGVLVCRLCWYQQSDKYLKKKVMVVGVGERAQQLEGLRRKTDRFGVDIVGFVDMSGSDTQAISENRIVKRVNGERFNFAEFFKQNNVTEIIIALDERRQNIPVDDILDCKMHGIHVVDVNTFLERQLGKINLDTLRPSSFIYSDGFSQNQLKSFSKRTLDIVVSLVMLTLALPLMLLTALAICLESGCRGTVFYKQERMGLNNKTFNIFKFRSMQENAENDGIARWAIKHDSRVTRVGSFIRKTRIDELPQLINVLKGDMSFVGPRPERPQFVNDLSNIIPFYTLRSHIKPGITGWAQICFPYGASIEDAKEKLQYDLYYLKHHNIFLDILVLLQTAAVIVSFKGAR